MWNGNDVGQILLAWVSGVGLDLKCYASVNACNAWFEMVEVGLGYYDNALLWINAWIFKLYGLWKVRLDDQVMAWWPSSNQNTTKAWSTCEKRSLAHDNGGDLWSYEDVMRIRFRNAKCNGWLWLIGWP